MLLGHLDFGRLASLGSTIVSTLSGQLGGFGGAEISIAVPAKQTKGD